MAADVSINGAPLGSVSDQFLRYAFAVPSQLLRAGGANQLSLAFGTSRDPRNAEGRFSGASGGWDVSLAAARTPQPKCARGA